MYRTSSSSTPNTFPTQHTGRRIELQEAKSVRKAKVLAVHDHLGTILMPNHFLFTLITSHHHLSFVYSLFRRCLLLNNIFDLVSTKERKQTKKNFHFCLWEILFLGLFCPHFTLPALSEWRFMGVAKCKWAVVCTCVALYRLLAFINMRTSTKKRFGITKAFGNLAKKHSRTVWNKAKILKNATSYCVFSNLDILDHRLCTWWRNGTYVIRWRATAGVDGRVAFTLRRGLQTLPGFNFSQKLRVITSGRHHVEGFGA